MEIGQTIGAGGAMGGVGGATATAPNGFSRMSSQEFLKVLLTQLKSQDPLQPKDSSQLLQQLSSIRSIESQMALQNQLEKLVLQDQIAAAGNLIGKLVQGLDQTNHHVKGVVTAVRVVDDKVLLELDTGRRLAMSHVTGITQADATTQMDA